MKVSILGTIVSPDYDDSIFAPWVEKGVITPSSRIINAVESATEPVDLYINSYGGDVFAGGEMYIALIKAAFAGKIASVEVGSMAASMAANIVVSLKARGVRICGYSNTQLMFHGCFTETEGGAQHLEDVARSIRNINEKVIEDLNYLGIRECRAWFNEGREMWLSANDLLDYKIFDSLSDALGAKVPEMKTTATRLAALAKTITNRKEYSMDIDHTIQAVEEEKKVEAVETVEPTTPAVEDNAAVEETVEEKPVEAVEPPSVEADIEARVTALANERFSGLQAKHEKMISELKSERDAALKDLEAVKAVSTSLQADVEHLEASLAEVRDQLAKEKEAHEAVVAKALMPKADVFRGNARETLASLPVSERAAFYAAHKAEIDK